jgi:hypothetical protein
MQKLKVGDKAKLTGKRCIYGEKVKPFIGIIGYLSRDISAVTFEDSGCAFSIKDIKLISKAEDIINKYLLIDQDDTFIVFSPKNDLIEYLIDNEIDPSTIKVYEMKKEVDIKRKSSYEIEG